MLVNSFFCQLLLFNQLVLYLNFSYFTFSNITSTLYLWSIRCIPVLLVYMIYSVRSSSHFQNNELGTSSIKKYELTKYELVKVRFNHKPITIQCIIKHEISKKYILTHDQYTKLHVQYIKLNHNKSSWENTSIIWTKAITSITVGCTSYRGGSSILYSLLPFKRLNNTRVNVKTHVTIREYNIISSIATLAKPSM